MNCWACCGIGCVTVDVIRGKQSINLLWFLVRQISLTAVSYILTWGPDSPLLPSSRCIREGSGACNNCLTKTLRKATLPLFPCLLRCNGRGVVVLIVGAAKLLSAWENNQRSVLPTRGNAGCSPRTPSRSSGEDAEGSVCLHSMVVAVVDDEARNFQDSFAGFNPFPTSRHRPERYHATA